MNIKEQIDAIAEVCRQSTDKIDKSRLVIQLMQLSTDINDATEVPADIFNDCGHDMRQLAVMGMASIMIQTVLK